MILPRELRPKLEPLESVVVKWPVSLSMDAVVAWILQFEPDDYDLGVRILSHLNVLGVEDIRSGLRVAYARLRRIARDRQTEIKSGNTIFAAIGDAGKSGGMIAYEFRIANGLPESNFSTEDRDKYLAEGAVKNIVLVDDVVGTGKTATSEAKRIVEEVTSLGVENVFVLSVCGFAEALDSVGAATGAYAISAFTYTSMDTVVPMDSDFYRGLDYEHRSGVLKRLKYYNRHCSRSELGHGSVGALLAFRHNSPNVSLPVIWASGNGWKPLFPRLGRVAGIENLYGKVRKAQRQKVETVRQAASRGARPRPEEEKVTLVCEGRGDELVLDYLIRQLGLAEKVGVKELATVSIGGMFASSQKIWGLIKETGGHFVLVVDGDRRTRHWIDNAGAQTGMPIVTFEPIALALLRVDMVLEYIGVTEEQKKRLADLEPTEEYFGRVEVLLRRHGFGRSASRTHEILERFLEPSAVESFAEKLKGAVEKTLSPLSLPPPA